MKKIQLIMTAILLAVVPAAAQETYENAKIAAEDLNGTARYVGMGGAMDALGADISTISTNPAGIGLFRSSSVSVSFGGVSQQDASNFASANKTNMSFDQAGFVWSSRSGRNGFLNIGVNYHKSRNFDMILSAADRLGNASQNKLTYAKAMNGLLYPTHQASDGNYVPDFDRAYITCNQLDDIYARNLNFDTTDNTWYYNDANSYTFDRGHKGYVGEYDFNISGNINDRVYLGLTVGLHDVKYRHYSEYKEQLEDLSLTVSDERNIDGYGYDVKAGVIFRPVEASPFRIGFSVATPIFYDLKTENLTSVSDGSTTVWNGEKYDFKLYTPWKFGVSMGHTVGNMLAIGASYEFADYAHLDTRYNTGDYYDYWYDSYYSSSSSDNVMNDHTKQTLKGVSTLKVGAELKPDKDFAIRLGYNYVSPMYQKDGFKDGTLDTDGSYYSSATDYTNWNATNRITCGFGYNIGQLSLDLAYQYSSTSGNFSPFASYYDNKYPEADNICNEVKVNFKRHQLLFTAGYRF